MLIHTLLLAASLSTPIECGPAPGDPPWRWITCYVMGGMGEWPTRIDTTPAPITTPPVEWGE